MLTINIKNDKIQTMSEKVSITHQLCSSKRLKRRAKKQKKYNFLFGKTPEISVCTSRRWRRCTTSFLSLAERSEAWRLTGFLYADGQKRKEN